MNIAYADEGETLMRYYERNGRFYTLITIKVGKATIAVLLPADDVHVPSIDMMQTARELATHLGITVNVLGNAARGFVTNTVDADTMHPARPL